MLFSCCENLVGIYKNAKAAFDKSSSKNFKYFLCEYQELAKQVSLRGITISLHCLIHLLHNQKSCTIKVQVNLRLAAEVPMLLLHVIALYIFLCTL